VEANAKSKEMAPLNRTQVGINRKHAEEFHVRSKHSDYN
jgi:hypothetical protein